MKKIIALALALIMVLSMGVVALAADHGFSTLDITANVAPGDKLIIDTNVNLTGYKISKDFTNAANDYCGASYIDEIKIAKNKEDVELTLKESFTVTDAKLVQGRITLSKKGESNINIYLTLNVNNASNPVVGVKKLSDTSIMGVTLGENLVNVMDEDGGYVTVALNDLSGTVKMEKDEKVQIYTADLTEETADAVAEYLGEDYEGLVEYYNFVGTGFKSDVEWAYDAYAEDPHFFYIWDGEKFVDLEAKYDDDEEVDDYVFTAPAKGLIIVTDVELVAAAEETKNPDTGANDVVGVAAALAVVSLVAAGAVSLKK